MKEGLTRYLKRYFGFDTFKGDQEAVVRNVLAGNDTFVLMPTGGGKSLCYQLPALMLEGTAIVVSPLIALMKNQVDMIRNLADEDSIAHFMNSTLSKSALEKVRQDVLSGKTKMLYIAPETLTKEDNLKFFRKMKVSFYAIDEAHCISEWGHDFRVEYRKLRPTIDLIGRAPIIALTATATDKVKNDIKKNLGIVDSKDFKSSFNRPNLYYEIRPKTTNIDKEIIKYIKANPYKSGIIYCLSRKRVETLAEVLCVNQIKAAPYHAGMEAAQRTQTQDDFLMERINVIVATIAFGMGIDKPDVRFVIHYEIPKSLEGYYQETGRAGRDGGEGKCIAFYAKEDLKKLEKFMEDKPIAEQDIGKQLLRETAAYAESSVCRRKLLLHYFGEKYEQENCGKCDNCLKPQKKMEAKQKLIDVLQTVQSVKENYNEEYIYDIIMGNETEEILANRHDDLDQFGMADDDDDEDDRGEKWSNVIRCALLEGYLDRDVENRGALFVTPKGLEFLKQPTSFIVTVRNSEEEDDGEGDGGNVIEDGLNCAVDPVLFIQLKDLRKKMSKEHDLPPYVIFQDGSLEAMATTYPVTIEELQNIPGVGAGKANKFGAAFCALIKKHCDENEIERPEDVRVRTVANKSRLKVHIIQSIDRLVALDDIAEVNGIDFDELLDEVEAIVYSGTKINIDYFLSEVIDEDKRADIYAYFQESETDDLDEALDELGDEYTEEEIRLMRIKFLSDNAN